MNKHEQKWDRLVELARQAPKAPDAEAPLGFATRVVANWPKSAAEPSIWTIWEGLSLRFLGVGLAIMIITVGASYSTLAEDSHDMVNMTDSVIETVLQP